MDGFGDDVRVAELVVCNTTWFSTADVLPELVASPAYTAVNGYVLASRLDLVRVAMPLLLVLPNRLSGHSK